jgi:hypothetical protein
MTFANRDNLQSAVCRDARKISTNPTIDPAHHAEGRVDPKVRECQNGFRFWIPQSM